MCNAQFSKNFIFFLVDLFQRLQTMIQKWEQQNPTIGTYFKTRTILDKFQSKISIGVESPTHGKLCAVLNFWKKCFFLLWNH